MTTKTSRANPVALHDLVVTDPDTGELIRKDTGEVISDNALSQEKEWRAFGSEGDADRARTGAPVSLAFHDMGLSTVIGKESTDASGNQIDSATQMRMGRLRMWHSISHSHSPKERSLQQAFTMLSKIKDRLGLPDYVIEKAAYVYRKAQERGLIRGDSIGSVLAASIYTAVRQSGVLRTLDEISASIDVKPKQAGRSYRRIVTELDIKVPMIDHARYIIRIANRLELDERTKRKALELIEQARKKDLLAGRDPIGMAASILYLVNLEEKSYRTQADIAKAAGVTEVTVRNRSKELRNRLDMDSNSRSTLRGQKFPLLNESNTRKD
ncbi:MAG: transcription initiation factor IIB [Nitrososphaera sp.]|uniref:transcription initiation factor IIB n=1 Tax=Candidatus Nitrososphaera gargensis TaxID=497727 RepID=UPI001E3B0D14|nr:transcription initiation factor IIB [Candidatus Nitrososphaera gargensis]